MVDELKTEGGLARVIAAVLVGAAGAFGYAAGWLSPNYAPPSLVFSHVGDQVASLKSTPKSRTHPHQVRDDHLHVNEIDPRDAT